MIWIKIYSIHKTINPQRFKLKSESISYAISVNKHSSFLTLGAESCRLPIFVCINVAILLCSLKNESTLDRIIVHDDWYIYRLHFELMVMVKVGLRYSFICGKDGTMQDDTSLVTAVFWRINVYLDVGSALKIKSHLPRRLLLKEYKAIYWFRSRCRTNGTNFVTFMLQHWWWRAEIIVVVKIVRAKLHPTFKHLAPFFSPSFHWTQTMLLFLVVCKQWSDTSVDRSSSLWVVSSSNECPFFLVF